MLVTSTLRLLGTGFLMAAGRTRTSGTSGFAGLALLLCLVSSPASAGENVIFPGDKLALKVLEWLPARGEYREWTAIGGQYEVSGAQTIAIPFLGDVGTQGRDMSALSSEIAGRLQSEMTLATKPAVSIEFIQRASIFVMGGVQSPGAVPFQPGMTVGKAVALAGGYYREAGATLRLERDVISAQATMRLAEYQAARSLARMARLENELADRPTIAPPTEAAVPVPTPILEEEQRILDVRRDARATRIASIQNVKKLATDQVKAVKEKAANIDTQIQSLRKELQDVQGLVGRGLATNSRGFTLERTLADFEGRRIDLDLAMLQAELQIGQADRDVVNVETEFRSRASNELQEARGELERNLNSLETASALLNEAAQIAPERILDRSGNLAVTIEIQLDRNVEGVVSTTTVGSHELLMPGDVVQIQMKRAHQDVDVSVLERARANLNR